MHREALRLQPDFAEAYYNLGNAWKEQGHPDEAAAAWQEALRCKPDFAEAHNNLSLTLCEQGRLEDALERYRQALRSKPDLAEAHNNLGNVLRELGRLPEAEASFRDAVRLKPDFPEAHNNLAMHLLLLGKFAEGWAEYEWRWQTRQLKRLGHFSQPLWQGEALPQGVILLHAEQGMGDTLQFIRFAAEVKARVGTVLCECPPTLAALLRSCRGIDRVIPVGEKLPAFDVHAPLMSLPGILGTTVATIPADIPYLDTDGALTQAQAEALTGTENFKIGIVWQGNPRSWDPDLQRADRRRSMPLSLFETIARVPGVRLFSLQKGFGAEQLVNLAERLHIADLGSTCATFSDTAAVMKKLDLVISADSSPAHVAGALGVPVWVPLPAVGCWRWLTQREDSPWYPTMRLFRQTSLGDWSGVFARMARELEQLTLARARGASK